MSRFQELLAQRSDAEEFEPEEPIFHEDEPGAIAFYLLAGEVALERGDVLFRAVRAGELFGEGALLGESRRDATARAVTAVRAAPISRPLFELLKREDPSLEWRVRTSRRRFAKRLAIGAMLLFGFALATTARAVGRRAFVTSVTGSGDLHSWADSGGLSGLAAADQICRTRAAAGGLPNAIAYRAWISNSTTDAYCHVRGQSGSKGSCTGGSPTAAGPWYLRNGITKFSGSLDELTGPQRIVFRPALLDEFGNDLVQSANWAYWTGSLEDGTHSMHTCASWTSASSSQSGLAGAVVGSSSYWTDYVLPDCSKAERLLCLEPGDSDAPTYWSWQPGNLVFVTSVSGKGKLSGWPEAQGASGIAAGDAICRNLAAAAHLPAPDSFVAWLSTAAVDAKDRLTSNGPYLLPSGLPIANSKADLLDGATALGINMDESGAYLHDGGHAWTGTSADGVLSSNTCEDWLSDVGPDVGDYGAGALSRDSIWSRFGYTSCVVSNRLFCISNATTLFWDGFEYSGDASRWTKTSN